MGVYNVRCRSRQKHILYRTTNTVNGRSYIGIHSTDNIEDGYLGSGWLLKSAVEKYGREAFTREVLATFSTRKEALAAEAAVVTEEFVSRPETYNLVVGGMGVVDQWGRNNPQFGRDAPNRKAVRATHRDGRVIEAPSIGKLSDLIGIARGNIRNLIHKGIVGKRGWRVECCQEIV